MLKGDFSAFKKCNYVTLVISFVNLQFAKKKKKKEKIIKKPTKVIRQRVLSLQPIKGKMQGACKSHMTCTRSVLVTFASNLDY